MPRPQERQTLTIELKREGENLVRTYLVPIYGKIASYRSPFDAIGADYEAGSLRGLAALHGVLARGDGAELGACLSGAPLDRAGAALFEALFGGEGIWGPVLRSVFQRPEPQPQPDPCWDALRVRICTRDPVLQGLPWRASMWSGRLLLDEEWTFEVCFDSDPEPCPDLHAPGTILVIAPETTGMAPLGTAAHLRAIGQIVDSLSPGHSSSPRFQVVRSLSQLDRALRGMLPDIVYFYGHGDVEGEQLRLHLGDGRPEPVLMRDFARLLRDTPPRVIVLNGCHTGQAGWHSAGAQLLPQVPLVIANATTAWSESAGRFTVQWLGTWLKEGLDPVVALHQLGRRASTDGVAWITPVVHAHYRVFTTIKSRSSRTPYLPSEWLDREEQRDRVLRYIFDIARDPKRRVMAVVAYGTAGNSLELLSRQIIARVERDAGDRLRIRPFLIRFPEQRAIKDLTPNLEQSLKIQLGHEPTAALEHVLRAHAPRRVKGATPFLWLDWGVFGELPERQPSLSPEQVTTWLKFVRDRIAPVCPDDLRIIATAALEVEPALLSKLSSKLSAFELDFRTSTFRFRTIPPLEDVKVSEILDYLEHTDCPVDIAPKLAKLIYDAKKGRYSETVEFLERGSPAWYPLYDELCGAAPGTPENTTEW